MSGERHRDSAADYYDLGPHHPEDLAFYRSLLPGPEATVLELGCGTGRISIPLAGDVGSLHGLDHSPAMMRRLGERVAAMASPPTNLTWEVADITAFGIGRRFDLIIAPFRVLQNLETDMEVHRVFDRIREHLAPRGCCVLNVFHPNDSPVGLIAQWSTPSEVHAWTVMDGADRVECHVNRRGVQANPLVLYPQLIYRRFRGDALIDESSLEIAMRCYYPDEFEDLVRSQGFEVLDRWGGYAGEAYGQGGELILAFGDSSNRTASLDPRAIDTR